MIMGEIVNDSKSWQEKRRNFIGASELATLLGFNKYQTPLDVWYSKVYALHDWAGNDATKLGHTLEPALLSYAEESLGCELTKQVHYTDAENFMAATVDGIDTSRNIVVECKTAGLLNPMFDFNEEWGDELTDQVPMQYWVQVQAQLLLTQSELGYLFALIAGRGIIQYSITPDSEMQSTLRKYCKQWWNQHVSSKIPPDCKVSIETLKRVRRERTRIDLPDEAIQLINEYQSLSFLSKEVSERASDIKSKLIAMLGNADEGLTSDNQVVSFMQRTRKAYQVKESTYPAFAIRKNKTQVKESNNE